MHRIARIAVGQVREAKRQRVGARYNQAFSEIKKDGFQIPIIKSDRTSVWAQYTLSVFDRATFQKKLTDAGVPTSIHYPRIMPDQPWYKEHTADPKADLSKGRAAAEHVISLPLYPDMTNDIQDRVIEAVIKAMA